jgi:hypothetical protein
MFNRAGKGGPIGEFKDDLAASIEVVIKLGRFYGLSSEFGTFDKVSRQDHPPPWHLLQFVPY